MVMPKPRKDNKMQHHADAIAELTSSLVDKDLATRKQLRDCWTQFAAAALQNQHVESAEDAAYLADRMLSQYLKRGWP